MIFTSLVGRLPLAMFDPLSDPPLSRPSLVFLVFALVLGGCGGGSMYTLDPGTIAQRFLPTTRQVDHHPDSLRALSVQEEERRFRFDLDGTYESLHRKWSSTYQDLGAGRSRRGRSYATFWSLELSLASLQPEMGFTSLSKERAQKALQERRQEYKEILQFEVYWFEQEGNSLLVGPSARVQLRVDEEDTYEPSRESHSPLRDAFLPGETRAALYRRNTFYFSRVVDSTDILAEAEKLELVVSRPGMAARVRFTWTWEDASTAARRPRGPRGWGQAETGSTKGLAQRR
ncbi:MAG TPA: hypothetical protein VJ884_08750 [Salinibacter sp.]|nr:hypothetical protein [Salinibacter sp.]